MLKALGHAKQARVKLHQLGVRCAHQIGGAATPGFPGVWQVGTVVQQAGHVRSLAGRVRARRRVVGRLRCEAIRAGRSTVDLPLGASPGRRLFAAHTHRSGCWVIVDGRSVSIRARRRNRSNQQRERGSRHLRQFVLGRRISWLIAINSVTYSSPNLRKQMELLHQLDNGVRLSRRHFCG
jgi:hypothetical protein